MSIFNEEEVKRKFLKFKKEKFKVEGAHCRVHDWNKFIVYEFKEKIELATIMTQKLIQQKYISIVKKNNEEFVAVTGYGFEMIKHNRLEVDL